MSSAAQQPPPPDRPSADQTVELLRRARHGDRSAREDLLTRYAPRVRGLAALRMGRALVDCHDWEDVVQDALITASEQLERFEHRGDGSFVCWLAAIVESRVASAQRSGRALRRGGGKVRRTSELSATTAAGAALPIDDRGPSPSAAMRAHELDPELERALLGLDVVARQIVYCRLVLDMAFDEIAGSLELAGADTTRARFHKAVAKLRARLGDDGG